MAMHTSSSSSSSNSARQTTTKRMILLVTCGLLLRLDSSECFAPRSTFGRSACTSTSTTPSSSTSLRVFRNDPESVIKLTSPFAAGTLALPVILACAAPLFHSTIAIAATATATATATSTVAATAAATATPDHVAGGLSTLLSSPLVEAHVLSDVAHLTLDLATFFGPAKLAIRAAAVLGRIAAMGADYLPDHSMLPEELVFQVGMLGIAWVALVKSAMPVVLSVVASNITLRDGKAFTLLFGPAGMTWPQYKALSVTALDWVTIEPGKIITSDEQDTQNGHGTQNAIDNDNYIYWLYAGQTVIESQGKVLHNVTRVGGPASASMKKQAGRGLLGEMRLLRSMQAKERGSSRGGGGKQRKNKNNSNNNSSNNNKDYKDETTKSYPRTTVKAGDAGATLLRIHTSNLIMFMDHDVDLAHAVRSLLFQGMHDKLAARLEESFY
jgi:hypothetical protein